MSIETIRELETLASVCPELNMANYTEDDVRHLNDWAIEMSLLVERYALSQQPAMPEPLADHSDHVAEIAARLRLVAKLAGCPDAVPDEDGRAVGCIFSVLGNMRRALEKKLATGEPTPQDVVDAFEKARAGSDKPVGILRGVRAVMRLLPDLKPAPDPIAPATPEPVKVVPYNPTTEMMFSMKGLDPALSLSQCRELWSVAWKAAPTNHPAPSAPGDVVRDAERYRWLRDHDHWPAPFSSSQEPEPVRGRDLDAAIDAAMLAATVRAYPIS